MSRQASRLWRRPKAASRRCCDASIADALNAPSVRIASLPVGRPQKVTVRFRESEMRQLAEVSHQRGMTRTGWIVALVRSRLGSPVQHSPDEHAVASRHRPRAQ